MKAESEVSRCDIKEKSVTALVGAGESRAAIKKELRSGKSGNCTAQCLLTPLESDSKI